MRFGGLSEAVRPDLESEQSNSADEDHVGLPSGNLASESAGTAETGIAYGFSLYISIAC